MCLIVLYITIMTVILCTMHCYVFICCITTVESPTNSTHSSPVMSHKTFVSRLGPQRHKKCDKSSGINMDPSDGSVEMFATARGTVKFKRRFSHDEGVCVINKTIDRSIIRASSDGNIVNNCNLSPQHSQHSGSHSGSSNSLSNYPQVPPIDPLSLPQVSISPSVDDVAKQPKIKRQFTSETSQSLSTSSDHYGDIESESEVMLPGLSCPTPKAPVQLPVPLKIETISMSVSMNNLNDNCSSNLVTEMMKQFPLLLRSPTSPTLSNLSHNSEFSHSLPNDLHVVGLESSSGEEYSGCRKKRCNTVIDSVDCVTSSNGNPWLNKAHTLSEICEDSAESRASTKSPSPAPQGRTQRARSDAFCEVGQINVTRLGVKKSDSFDRKFAAAQEIEQAHELSRIRAANENGRRGSFFSRLLPMRGKGKRHQSESDARSSVVNNKQMVDKALLKSQPISIRPSSPSSLDPYSNSLPSTYKSVTQKKTRFSSVLRRKKEPAEVMLPSRDFSLTGGRLSPSPGARYGDNLLQQRSVLLSIYSNLNYWLCRHKEV